MEHQQSDTNFFDPRVIVKCEEPNGDDPVSIEPVWIKQEKFDEMDGEENIGDSEHQGAQQTSSHFDREFKREPSETRSPTAANCEPEEYLTCALKGDPVNAPSVKRADVDGNERCPDDFKHGSGYESEGRFECYENEPRDDPLAVERVYIKQENVMEEENIVEEQTQETLGVDEHLSSTRENIMKIPSKTVEAQASIVDSKNTVKSVSNKKRESHKKNATTRGRDKPYQCTMCSYESDIANELKRHMAKHTKEKPYKCKRCGYSTGWAHALSRHMTSHTEDKPYKCTSCAYSTSWSGALKRHMTTHTESKPFKCALCPYSSREAGGLKKHTVVHTGVKPFKCTVCPYNTSWANALKGHMTSHTKDKPFKCAICSYSSRWAHSLKGHMTSHARDKPYKCTVCSYSSSWANALKAHMTSHTKDKPFKCTVCSYSSSWAHHLKGHVATHLSVKPFQCAHCSQRFTTKLLLTRHILSRHPFYI